MITSIQNNKSCSNGPDICIRNKERNKNYIPGYVSISLFERKETGVRKESEINRSSPGNINPMQIVDSNTGSVVGLSTDTLSTKTS
jgi:hypothetical protein